MEATPRQERHYGLGGAHANVLVHPTATRDKGLDELADLIAVRIAGRAASAGSATALLTVREVLAARRGLTKSWLYANAAAGGAIRKNDTKRSPLWFRLEDVDAELDRRRKAAMGRTEQANGVLVSAPSSQLERSRQRYCTAKGSPRTFAVRPRVGA